MNRLRFGGDITEVTEGAERARRIVVFRAPDGLRVHPDSVASGLPLCPQ